MQVTSVSLNSAQALESLVISAQKGDREAFNELVSRTHKMLRKIALPLLASSQIDDALQESYLLMYQKLHHLREPKAIKSWLSRITLHVCYGLRRASKTTEPLSAAHDKTENPEGSTDIASLRQTLSKLKKRDRNILILREYLDVSYEEIADILDIPAGTVKSRLFNARKKLAKIISSESK